MTSTCCRLCLSNSDELESIFSVKNGSLLLDLIKIICPIPIETAEDDLPQSICQECVEIVTSAHQIRVLSVQSDFKLRSLRYHDPLIKSEAVIESSVIVEASDNWDNDAMQHSEYEPDTFSPSFGNKSEVCRVNKRLAKRLKCDRCQFRTSFKNTMAAHTRSHLKDDAGSAEKETQFQCNSCENVYANRSDRQRHIRHEHQVMKKHTAKESFGSSSSNRHTEDQAAGSSSFQGRVQTTDNRQTTNMSGTGILNESQLNPKTFKSVWENFDKPTAGSTEATCQLCVKLTKIKCPNSTTSTLIRHLQKMHGLQRLTDTKDLQAARAAKRRKTETKDDEFVRVAGDSLHRGKDYFF